MIRARWRVTDAPVRRPTGVRLGTRAFQLARVATLLAATAGCEHGVDGAGIVRVPPDVRGLFTASAPGDLLVEMSLPGGISDRARIAYLCGGGASTYRATLFDFGCAPAGTATVTAWAAPHDPSLGSGAPQFECDRPVKAADRFVFRRREAGFNALAIATQTVPVERSGFFGCKNGSLEFDLELQR